MRRVFCTWRATRTGAVERLIEGTGSRIPPKSLAIYRRLFQSSDHVAGALAMMANWDLGSLYRDLPELRPELLQIIGSADRAIPPDQGFQVASHVPGAKVDLLRGVGHLAHKEAPRACRRVDMGWRRACGVCRKRGVMLPPVFASQGIHDRMKLPEYHPLRMELNDEVHARPPQAITVPARISYMALISPPENADRERAHISELCERKGLPVPERVGNHHIADFGEFRVKWERHTEFARYKIIAEGDAENAFTDPAINLLPPDWLADLSGELLTAANVALMQEPPEFDPDQISEDHFSGNALIGSSIAGGSAKAFTDFRITGNGFTRLMIFNRDMTLRQTGRTVQRLLEIDTYRMMALLTFPVARELRPFIAGSDTELAQVTKLMGEGSVGKDQALLDRLVQLEAAIESRYADHQYRFSAADAYYGLVQNRIAELREDRVQGFQTFGEFMERRLAPAMSTCRSVSDGMKALSERVERTTQLLSTRVGMAREQQNQKLLETMARRAKMQLRLQQTVEGLSVAAISYYVVGLVGYGAKALKAGGLPVDPNLAMGAALPVVIVLAAFGIRNIRKRLAVDSGKDGGGD